MFLELHLVATTLLLVCFTFLPISMGWSICVPCMTGSARYPRRCWFTLSLQTMQGILAVLFAVAAYRLLPYWLLILFATWFSRLLPSAVLMYGLLASLAYQVLKHACGGLAICVAKLVIQGRHNFNEWLRLFRRCIRMRRSYLRTSSRLLTGSFYALMLIMFSSLGPTCAVVVAYATVWAICRSHAVFHGPWCRSSTAVAVGFPVAMLWGWAPGVIVSGLAGMLPTYMLWWPVSSRKGHRVGDEGEPKEKYKKE